MLARATLYTSPGGDTVQITSTAQSLRALGVKVDIRLSNEEIKYSDYHLMHFFNIIRPDDILPHIKQSALPFVVSTIFVDYGEFEKRNRQGILKIINTLLSSDQMEYLKTVARFILNGDKINSLYYLLNGHSKSIKYVAKHVKMLLPNSDSEFQRFVKSYGGNSEYRKVPNAIDPDVFDDNVIANHDFKDHVLCVGRIEGRKNQLNLIKALAGTELKLTLIGKPSPNHMKYFTECKKLASENSNVQIIEHIDHEQLSSIYKAAKVHVLPSWFETTGLSSLEAGIMDCNIVVTDKGDTVEYFGDLAFYCDPDSVESIREAVVKAHKSVVKPDLKEKIIENYTWDKAAEETYIAYKKVLNVVDQDSLTYQH